MTLPQSYNPRMKTAISLPDRVVRRVERYAQQIGKSKNQLFAAAVTEYLALHASNGSNGKTIGAPGRKRPIARNPAKSRFSKSKLRLMARNHPPPKSWFQEPAVDLTKPE